MQSALTVAQFSVLYLAWRAIVAALRIRWARHAYSPMPVSGGGIAGEHRDRCRGCLVGLGIGDALNLPAESVPRWLARLRYPGPVRMRRGFFRLLRRAGDVSDDTQLSIAVARSIDPGGRYRHERFLDELGLWSYFRIGAGRASSRAAVRARRGNFTRSDRSCGNGAAIRVAPLAMASRQSLMRNVRENARATHGSESAVAAALFVALLIRECLEGPQGLLDDRHALTTIVERAASESGFDIDIENLEVRAAPSAHVAQCIPAVVATLLAHGSDLRGAMTSIFRSGGDSDSVGAMVGACIGAQIGYRALPATWGQQLQHRDILLSLADRLASPGESQASTGELVRVSGDITERNVDAIVNAWNRNLIPSWLLIPQGVSGAIRRRGGAGAIAAVSRKGPLPLGSAVESSGGELAATWILHAAAINLAWRSSEASIRAATRSALRLAQWLGVRTVALPVLGAGSGGFPREAAAKIVCEECSAFLGEFERIEVVTGPSA